MSRNRRRLIGIGVAVCAVAAAATGLGLYLSARNPRDGNGGRTGSIVVAYAPFESTALVWIAEDQRLFSRGGLTMTWRRYDSGVGALDGLLNGDADLAVGTTEFPLVGSAFRKDRIRATGTIAKSEFIYIVGRKDRGIETVADLKGKRVGTTLRTIAEFYLGRFLELHGINQQGMTLVDLKTPAEWVNAIVAGDVDAVATAQPYANAVKDRLGANAVVWSAQSGQPLYALAIATDAWIANNPRLLRTFLTSLAQAEQYLFRNPAEARAIVQKRLGLEVSYMDSVWLQNQFSLSLDESLILAMEEEARWMIKNNLTGERQVPNFLDHIHEGGLKVTKPEAVNIIR